MNTEYVYRMATEKDINILQSSDVEFHYIKSIRSEIVGDKASNFLWIIMENESKYCGFARCKKICSWWIMEGLYVDKNMSDIWAAYKLTQYTIYFLQKTKDSGILSWTDSASSGKANIFIKCGFEFFQNRVYRFILYKQSMEKLLSLGVEENERWSLANCSDYKSIMELSQNGNSFVSNIFIDESDEMVKWLVNKEGNKIVAAVCWWKHDDLLDIHYTLSENANFDCVGGIIKIVQMEYDDSVTMLKINLEPERLISLIKILRIHPSTYNTGYIHYLLKCNTKYVK